jgi:hypothetical protein
VGGRKGGSERRRTLITGGNEGDEGETEGRGPEGVDGWKEGKKGQ